MGGSDPRRLPIREGRPLAPPRPRRPEPSAEAAAEAKNAGVDRVRPLVPRLPVHPTGPSAGESLALRRLRRGRPRRNARDHPKDEEADDTPMTTSAPCPFCFPAEDRIAFEDRLTRGLWDAFPVGQTLGGTGHATRDSR